MPERRMTVAAPSIAETLYLPDAILRTSRLDLSLMDLPPVLRPNARRSVLDITEFYGDTTGGIRTYLRQKSAYVEAHADLRQVLVLPSPRDALSQSDGVRCYRLQGPKVPKQAPYRFMLATRTNRRIAVHERPDIIEVGSPGFVPWLARFAARGLDIPLVSFYHSNFPRVFSPFPETETSFRRAMADLAWKYARLIDEHFAVTIVCSNFAGDDLRRAGIDRVVRIPLGVDLDHYHPRRRASRAEVRRELGLPEGPMAAFVGRFAVEKEIGIALTAWPEVYRKTGCILALVGDGPMRKGIEARFADAPWLRLLPYQSDRARLADLLAATDLFVAPSSIETFGLAPLEAQSTGTPVLAADRGGISEQITAGGGGALFQAGKAASLAEVAVQLLRSDLAAIGAKGRAYAAADHSWDSVFDRIFALYDSVATR